MSPIEFIYSCLNGDKLIHPIYGEVSIRIGPLFNGNCVFMISETGEVVEGNLNDLLYLGSNDIKYSFISKNGDLQDQQVQAIIKVIDDNFIYDAGLLDHFQIIINPELPSNQKIKKRSQMK